MKFEWDEQKNQSNVRQAVANFDMLIRLEQMNANNIHVLWNHHPDVLCTKGTVQNSAATVKGKIMYPSVKKVIPAEDYLLSIDFDNGEKRILDMKPYLGFGVFQKLKERRAFNRVHVSFDTIEWESGIDLDPEFVYSKSQRVVAQQVAPADEEKQRG